MATTQSGYKALQPSSRLLYTWTVVGADTKLRLRRGPTGFLLTDLATRFDRSVEELNEPLLDDWGHAFRAIRGFDVLSNHAGGVAMDLNATDHPLGASETFSDSDERRIEHLLSRYDGCIRWGGNYHGRKDEMHFEIDKPMGDVERVARRIAKTRRGELILDANPGQRRLIL